MKIEILQLCPLIDRFESALASRFTVHEGFTAEARESLLGRHSANIRAVVTGGHIGIPNELAGRLPALEIVAINGVGFHIIDRKVLDAIGPQGALVNVARGSLVDEDALIAALSDGTLGAAALDVFADEPRVPDALRALPNVVLTPHIASGTIETRWSMAEMVLANLDAQFARRPLPTPVV